MEINNIFEVYIITNKINNKVYVGATSQGSAKRFKQHLWKAASGSNYALHQALREFGEENFKVETLETVYTVEDLKKQEKYWIMMSRANNPKYGYNGDCGGDIMFHTDETKAKISAIHKGKDMSKRFKAVLQYDLDGNFIQEFPSVTHASESEGVSRATLIRGLQRTTKGRIKNPYIWIYKEELSDCPIKINPKDYLNEEIERKVSAKFIEAGNAFRLNRDKRFITKPVIQFDKNHNKLAVFASLAEAHRVTGVSTKTIREYCSGIYKDRLKDENFLKRISFTWEYLNENDMTEEDKNNIEQQSKEINKKCNGNRKRAVGYYSTSNKLIKTFDTLQEAVSELCTTDRSTVGKQLNKKGYKNVANGYIKFID